MSARARATPWFGAHRPPSRETEPAFWGGAYPDWYVSPFGKVPIVADPLMPRGRVKFVAPDGRVLLTFENVGGP